jgi:hypothetical protein
MVFESLFNKRKKNETPHRKVADANIGRVLAAGLAAATANAEPARGMESVPTVAPITQSVSSEGGIVATPGAIQMVRGLSHVSPEAGKGLVSTFIRTHGHNPEDFIYDPAQDLYDAILSNKNHGLSEDLVQYIKDQIQEVNE